MAVSRFPSSIASNEIDGSFIENWYSTKAIIETCSFIWTIDNFAYCLAKKENYLKSPIFSSVSTNDNVKWRLELSYTRNFSNNYPLSLILKLVSCDKDEIIGTCKVCFMNSQNKIIDEFKDSYVFHVIKENYSEFFKEFTLHYSKLMLPDDKLIISCEIRINIGIVNVFSEKNVAFRKPENDFTKNLKEIFENQKFTDVIFAVQGKVFNAHKVILAGHSPVFSAMFECEMKENRENRVEVNDIDPEVFQEMLYFIYIGQTPNLKKMPSDLLIVADKYDLKELKVLCEQELFSKLSTETASEVLIVASTYNADELKRKAINFINLNTSNIIGTVGWDKLTKDYPHLVVDIFNASAEVQNLVTEPLCKKIKK